MEDTIIITFIVVLIFFIIKFVEIKFVRKETINIKDIIRDSIIVCIASILGTYLVQQFNITSIISGGSKGTTAFVDKPDF